MIDAGSQVSNELLAILVCPENRTAVSLAPAELLEKINEKIIVGNLKNRNGTPVTTALDAALVREDGKILYPVLDGIPIMLVEEGIEL